MYRQSKAEGGVLCNIRLIYLENQRVLKEY